jgi:hypothetical protein
VVSQASRRQHRGHRRRGRTVDLALSGLAWRGTRPAGRPPLSPPDPLHRGWHQPDNGEAQEDRLRCRRRIRGRIGPLMRAVLSGGTNVTGDGREWAALR